MEAKVRKPRTARIPERRARSDAKPTAEHVLQTIRANRIEVADLKFTDLPGLWQHFSIPAGEVNEALFTAGIGFDGSSIRGFQKIHESDMLLAPDPAAAFVDPVLKVPTLSLVCDIRDPVTENPYERDPRFIAKKAEQHLVRSGVAEVSYWGPELEHYIFIFDSARFDQNAHSGYYFIDSDEGIWNAGRSGQPNLAYRPRHKEGYFPVPPMDKLQDLRSEIMLRMMRAGIDIEVHHHEVGTAGQGEFDMRYRSLLLAGLDGIKHRMDPGDPVDEDLYELAPEAAARIKSTPGSLEEVLAALEADHDYLLEGGVFTQDLIDTWIAWKREKEVDAIRLRPHPYEFFLYFDI